MTSRERVTARERVVVTGVGVVSTAFTGGTPALGAFLAGSPRAGAQTGPHAAPAGGSSGDAMLGGLIEAGEARRLSRVCRFAVAAARLAVADAGLGPDTPLGVVVGTEFGDLRSTREFADGYLTRGPSGVSALLFPGTVMNTIASAVSIAVRARDASLTLNTPGVSGELAVARAAAAVAGGRLSVVLAGGVDETDGEVVSVLEQLGRGMDGRGEGATFLVLEARSAAERRGATILGELAGWAWRASAVRPRRIEEGHGSAGALRASGGVGGHVGAPHDQITIAAATTVAGCSAGDLRWIYRSAGDAGDDSRPEVSLAGVVGEHAGLGAMRVAAATWTARAGLLPRDDGTPATAVDRGPGLVHGRVRRGTDVALVVSAGEAGS